MGLIAQHLAVAQTPEGQIRAAADLATGQGDRKLNLLQTLGPVAGVTFSKGAPGGPAMGELYHAREQHQFKVNEALPEIRHDPERRQDRGDEADDRVGHPGGPEGLLYAYNHQSGHTAVAAGDRGL